MNNSTFHITLGGWRGVTDTSLLQMCIWLIVNIIISKVFSSFCSLGRKPLQIFSKCKLFMYEELLTMCLNICLYRCESNCFTSHIIFSTMPNYTCFLSIHFLLFFLIICARCIVIFNPRKLTVNSLVFNQTVLAICGWLLIRVLEVFLS